MVDSQQKLSKSTEDDIFDSLEDLGYDGQMLDPLVFQKAVDEGLHSVDFTGLVEWITNQLNGYAGLEEHVCAIADTNDADTFLMELSGFLREYGCPYEKLTEGPLQERFVTMENKLNLLSYLLTELLAAQITAVNHKQTKKAVSKTNSQSEVAEQLSDLCLCLGVTEPEDDVSASALCSILGEHIERSLSNGGPEHLGKPLLSGVLSEDNWLDVEYISHALKQDYNCRRQMSIQRLDLTIQSFRWSEKLQSSKDQMNSLYRTVRSQMTPEAEIDMAHLLAARDDLLRIEKTSGERSRMKTKCGVNQFLIGAVPDRGGRPYELERPSPEMPAFQRRRPHGDGSGGPRGGHDPGRSSHQRGGGWHGGKRHR